jgi:hypothetical protein
MTTAKIEWEKNNALPELTSEERERRNKLDFDQDDFMVCDCMTYVGCRIPVGEWEVCSHSGPEPLKCIRCGYFFFRYNGWELCRRCFRTHYPTRREPAATARRCTEVQNLTSLFI